LKKLSDHEIDEISELAIKSAENFIYSKVSKKEILDLDIKVELDYDLGLDVDIDVNIHFDPLSEPEEDLAEKAADYAINQIDIYLSD
jgi:hypothetical protein